MILEEGNSQRYIGGKRARQAKNSGIDKTVLILSTQWGGGGGGQWIGEGLRAKSKPCNLKFEEKTMKVRLGKPRRQILCMAQFRGDSIIACGGRTAAAKLALVGEQDLYVFSCTARRHETGNEVSTSLGISDLNELTAASNMPNSHNFTQGRLIIRSPISYLSQCTVAATSRLRAINARQHLLVPSSNFCRLCLLLPGSLDRAKQWLVHCHCMNSAI